MPGTRDPRKPKTPRYAGPEPRIGRIEFNPAPDAGDRLRRLFTLLASHLPSGDVTETEQDFLPDDSCTEDNNEQGIETFCSPSDPAIRRAEC